MTLLDEIIANKRDEVAVWKNRCSEETLCEKARRRPSVPRFSDALRSVPMAVIAEVKRRSPSAGTLRSSFDPAGIARSYAAAGAEAISVLMDERYFGGGESDFTTVRAAVELPLLFKEFVVDPWQIRQAAALGASAVLLIAAALSEERLRRLAAITLEAGLEPLVEVHDETELETALGTEAPMIGVNNRDLKTFRTDVETSLRLAPSIPSDRLWISESGIRTAHDLIRLQAAGAQAVLVGETLLRSADPAAALRVLRGE